MLVTIREQRYVSEPIETKYLNLDILLTVHLSIIYFSSFPTRYTAFLFTYNICYPTFLYMFQASQAHHQEV